jgi:myosin-1
VGTPLLDSADPAEEFGLQGPEAYAYTSNSGCQDVASIDDNADFKETLRAMDIIGLSQEEQTSIFRVLATILWLGNAQFVEGDDGNAALADPGVTDFVAYLMNTDAGAVQKVLLTRIMETQRGGRRGELFCRSSAHTRFRLRGPAKRSPGPGEP